MIICYQWGYPIKCLKIFMNCLPSSLTSIFFVIYIPVNVLNLAISNKQFIGYSMIIVHSAYQQDFDVKGVRVVL